MKLTDSQKKMHDGRMGPAAGLAMAILVDLAQGIGADEMVEISHVHTDSGFYLGDAGLEFVEHLAALGGKVAVPTSMNNTSYDIENAVSYGVPPELTARIRRLEKAHLQMGAQPTWTCAPYQDGVLPAPGENVAWSESNAIVFANSILGARTNRTGDLVDICCALTGCAPKAGLYLDENRKARIHLELQGIVAEAFTDPRFYPLLGYHIGNRFGNKVVAVSGVPATVTMDDLKGLGAAAASSGATALFHLIGITPEAKTPESCLETGGDVHSVTVGMEDIRRADRLLRTAEDDRLDWVALGCPHFSMAEFLSLVECLKGRPPNRNVLFTVFTSRKILKWARAEGILDVLNNFGIEVYADGCLLLYPNFLKSSGTMMTNSAKAANYIYSQAGFKAAYGSIDDCVRSAQTGKIHRSSAKWLY